MYTRVPHDFVFRILSGSVAPEELSDSERVQPWRKYLTVRVPEFYTGRRECCSNTSLQH
jgi:hypothetical protein